MAESTATRLIRAPRTAVYGALVDARAVSNWLPPAGTICGMCEFEPKVGGGQLRMAIAPVAAPEDARVLRLTYAETRPDELVVFGAEFEDEGTAMVVGMVITILLRKVDGGTEVTVRHQGLPPEISPENNWLGWVSSLANLANLVERGGSRP